MKTMRSLIVAGSVAAGAALWSGPAFASSAQSMIDQVNSLLTSNARYVGPGNEYAEHPTAAADRDEAVAALQAGHEADAKHLAALALRDLGVPSDTAVQ